jgi:hypothetical protein
MSLIIIVRAIVQPQPSLRASAERRIILKTTDIQAAEPSQKLPLLSRAKAAVAEGRLFSGVKRRLKPLVVTVGKAALRRSWIKRSVLAVLNSSPHLKNRLYRLVWKDIALSPRAMRIYTALSTAVPTHRKGSD